MDYQQRMPEIDLLCLAHCCVLHIVQKVQATSLKMHFSNTLLQIYRQFGNLLSRWFKSIQFNPQCLWYLHIFISNHNHCHFVSAMSAQELMAQMDVTSQKKVKNAQVRGAVSETWEEWHTVAFYIHVVRCVFHLLYMHNMNSHVRVYNIYIYIYILCHRYK